MPVLASLLVVALAGPGNAGLRPLDLPQPPWTAFPTAEAPAIEARAWIAYSMDHDAILAAKQPDLRASPASITKVMTAILVAENLALDTPITVSSRAGATPIGYVGQEDVRVGQTWSTAELLAIIMVGSGNRASSVLAEGVSGSLEAFAALMNDRAADFGMTATDFFNPHGLDATGHLSTARDIIALGKAAMEHPVVLDFSRIKAVTLAGNGITLPLESTNRDLGIFPGLLGIKTGDTDNAGQTLLSYTASQHDRILAVVLGSPNRRDATRQLVAWATTTLGPRDIFFAPVVGTEFAAAFSDGYLVRLGAAGTVPLAGGDPQRVTRTPLTDDLQARFRELLPEILGGDR